MIRHYVFWFQIEDPLWLVELLTKICLLNLHDTHDVWYEIEDSL